MRILYLSQYFPPEVGATQTRAYEMARGLVQAGHQVTMLCEVPNHPSGIIPPEYRGMWYRRDRLDGIDVLRVWVKASPVKTFGTRLAFYLSYMASATVMGLLRARGPFDLIYATSPPLFVGGAGLALHWLKRIPLVFEVRDLWPESAVAMGELSNPWAIRLSARLAQMCYQQSRRIVVVTEGIRQALIQQGLPADKIALIPNGANTDLFRPDPEGAAALRRQWGLENAFIVIYAGILGLAQRLETVLEAAALLRDLPQVHFLFVGTGPRAAALRAYQNELQLSNVTFLGQRPREQMPAHLSAANLALVPLRRHEIFADAVPSKMFDAWACGCPTLITISGEARRVLERAGAGFFVEPEDPAAMATAIRRWHRSPDALREMGQRGRQFVEQHYSRQAQARQLVRLLEAVAVG